MSGIAHRMIYGLENGEIVEYPVEISWDLGWDKDSKLEYIDRIRVAAYERYGIESVLDVTTANCSVENGKILSPHILKYPDTNDDIMKYFEKHGKNTLTPEMGSVALAYYYMYAICHTSEAYSVFHMFDYFFDVFWKPNPNKETQAYLCVLLKRIIHMKLHNQFFKVCEGPAILGFKKWYLENK